jgi:predicted 2-oxoglutarate/Fe(II)-dependent dioxygenase YbiX
VFSFEREILHVKALFPSGSSVIALAEEIGGWKQSMVSTAETSFVADARSCEDVTLSAKIDEKWEPLEDKLIDAFSAGARIYKAQNPYVAVARTTGFQIFRYLSGHHFHTHVDAVAGHPRYAARQLSAVLYLNDDYQGGHVIFPRQSIRLRPEAGDLLIWPSNFCFPHSVEDVLSGRRYTITTWFV